MELMQQDYLFYLIVHQKKMFNGQRKELVSSFKFIQKLWNLNLKNFRRNKKNHEKIMIMKNLKNIQINLLKKLQKI